MTTVTIPQAETILTEQSGRMTVEGHLMLLSMATALIEAQATIAAQAADIEALDVRVTALEP